MSPDDPRHGTEAGHEQHIRDAEESCAPCYEAKILASRRRSKRRAMGYRATVPANPARARLMQWRDGGATYSEIADHTGIEESRIWEIINDGSPRIYARTAAAVMSAGEWPVTALGVTRRIQALCRRGHSAGRIAEAAGVTVDAILDTRAGPRKFTSRKVRAGVLAAYDLLADRSPESTPRGISRVVNHAERMGWPPPAAWEDVDDPYEQPVLDERPRTSAELLAEWDHLRLAGVSIHTAASQLGVSVAAIEKACERVRKAAA